MNAKRNKKIDIAKGIGIILVVFAHILASTPPYVGNIIYYFHMPLFFFLAGVTALYSYNENMNFKEFVKKKIVGILIPYFIFSLIFFVYWLIIERKIRNQLDISVIDNFLNIFIAKVDEKLFSPNVVMWFLPCLFTTNILFFCIMKMKSEIGKILISIASLILGYLLSLNNHNSPMRIRNSYDCCILYILWLYNEKIY